MTRRITSCALLCAAAWISVAAGSTGSLEPTLEAAASVQERWGIEPVSLRPSMGGSLLDFRYRVVDALKAGALFDRKIKPYLLDSSRGVALGMPEETNLGALRASPRNPPVAGKQYYILFSNDAGTVKTGSKVTVVIGDCKLENVIVE